MRVFVLGGTGAIGTAVVSELVARNHRVLALSRSESSDHKLASNGAEAFRGDLSAPAGWVETAVSCDAIVQVAATFGDDMGDVDAVAMQAVIQAASPRPDPIRLIYTGGCWLYGETGNETATEDRPFDPLPAFAWMVTQAERLLAAPGLRTAVIHPAMVYDTRDGGVLSRYIAAAQAGQSIEVWGSAETRWPLIDSTDLARAYCDLVAAPDLVGHFNAVAEEGVAVGRIAATVSGAFGSPPDLILRSAAEVMKEYGAWAKGPTLDQHMSGRKLKDATGWAPRFPRFSEPICRWIADQSGRPG